MVSLNMVEYGLAMSEVLESMFFCEHNSIQFSTKFDFYASKYDNNCAQELILSLFGKRFSKIFNSNHLELSYLRYKKV